MLPVLATNALSKLEILIQSFRGTDKLGRAIRQALDYEPSCQTINRK